MIVLAELLYTDMYSKTTLYVLDLHEVIDGQATFVDKTSNSPDEAHNYTDKQVDPLKSRFWRYNPTIGRFYLSF